MAIRRIKDLWAFGRDVAREFGRDQCPFLAAGVCYFVVFALFPLLLGTISILGYVVSPEWALQQIHAGLGKAVPAQMGFVTRLLDQVVAARGSTGLIALALLLWSGKGVFMSLGQALDIIWNARRMLGWKDNLRRNALALVLAVGLGGAIVILSVAYWGLWLLLEFKIPGLDFRPSDVPGVLFLLSNVLPIVLVAVGLLLVYRFMPLRHLPGRAIMLGAGSAAVLWDLSRRIFGFYLDHFARFSVVYGPLSGVIAFMLWIYVSAILFLVGAEVAARYAHAKTQGLALEEPEGADSNSPSAR